MSVGDKALATLVEAAALAEARKPRAAAELRAHAQLLARCPEARRPLVLAALALVHRPLAPLVEPRERDRLLEQGAPWPGAPLALRARAVLGASPAELSGGLTRAEAHRWLTEAPDQLAAEWLLGEHALLAHGGICHVEVARWLISVWADRPRLEALTRHREERGPHGELVVGSYLDRIDELRPADLRPSVEETYRRCAARLLRDVQRLMAKKGEPLAPPPRWWRPIRCATLLLSAAELAAEGKLMEHCVASYAGYVRRGESVIVRLSVCGQRSTVELDRRTAEVRQHKGRGNYPPPDLCVRALSVAHRRWTERTKGRKA